MNVDNGYLADIFDKAADEILVRGHIKESCINAAGEVCALGALSLAAGLQVVDPVTDKWNGPPVAYHLIDRIIRLMANRLGVYTAEWNDAPERTADEVIEELRQTAKSLREDA
jgi:hypothetical protein